MPGFVAATGYGQLEAGILARVGYWNEILSLKCYEDAAWPQWVVSDAEDILMRHQVVKFTVADEPPPFRPYEKNQPLVSDEMSPYEVCAQMNFAEYSQDKLNDLDLFRKPEMFDRYMSERASKRVANYGETLNGRTIARFIAEASPKNQGPNAGMITASHALGTSAAPVSLSNRALVLPFLARLQAVAIETKCFGKGEGWHLVIPNQLNTALYDTPLASKFDLGACSELVCQNMAGNLPMGTGGPYGFRWWLNLEMSRPNGAGAVPIILFHESAQIFASDMVVNRVYEAQDFDRYYQMLLVSGGKVLKPHLVIVAWVTL
jgi:hypothetical protein